MKSKEMAIEHINNQFELANEYDIPVMHQEIDIEINTKYIEEAIDIAIKEARKETIAEFESRAEATTLCDHVGDDQEALIIKSKDFDDMRFKLIG